MDERLSPIRAQNPDPDKIACKDCIYRDKAELKFEGEVLKVGITRDTCLRYDHKPSEVLFMNEACPQYARE